ncbi:MAG: glycosyl hydrolase [Sedimentisphaerales bacterium]|nr:glycosyl hydrolase [Sedimentisphaerales bacterium]
MNRGKAVSMVLLTAIAVFLTSCTEPKAKQLRSSANNAQTANSTQVKALFADPPRQYSSAPLWVWNDMLTEEQIVSTMRDLAGQKVKQVFVHPRPGLMTPYLSDDWFRLWKVALKEAERLDMNVWIYDENSYPSGFAGGLVPEAMPESRGLGLHFSEVKSPQKTDENTLAVYRLTDNGYENVTEQAKAAQPLPEGRYLVGSIRQAPTGGWFGGKYYVDLLAPGVTEKFIAITLDAYRRELGEHFGKRLPGVFTDEPHLSPAGGIHWSHRLPGDFKKRWGYELIDNLPSLIRPIGDYKKVRHNFFQLLLELFIERWAKPCYEYCDQHDLEFTGHYWEHGWPGAGHGGDNMAMYAWHHRPAIDTLMNQYSESTNAQFGNVRAVKELASVANQLGRTRTLCEAYGAGGWDLRFEDMKRIGDWLYVLGVNTLDEHLSYITIRGARKRDHPQSFSYHEPWWQSYNVMASYFTRLSAALSSGKQVNTVLLIEPTTTTWMYQPDSSQRDKLNKIGNEFQKMATALSKAQVEYDIGCEDIITRNGSVEGTLFRVGKRNYEVVVIPPLTENLNSKTMSLLETYIRNNGIVLCCDSPPGLVDGKPSNRAQLLSQNAAWKRIDPAAVPAVLTERSKGDLTVQRDNDDKGILFHHRRRLDDGDILFLVNTSIDSSSTGSIESAMKGLEQWDLETGTVESYPFVTASGGTKADFELPPCGSLLLFLSKQPGRSPAPNLPKTSKVQLAGKLNTKRVDLNVLTLDYVDIKAGGESKENLYVYQANQFAFQKNGMERNPWDSAVQFRDELITKKFEADSGFEAAYHFTIEQRIPKPLYIVIERADLYTITCNGKEVSAQKGSWWLDKAFGKINITSAAGVGENTVTIKASPMTIYHELESAYVLGDFALKAADSGFTIVPEVPLKPGPWNRQGCPFYAAGVSYNRRYRISRPSGKYVVSLTDWYGSVAEVRVNGKSAGHIYRKPWECDVTKLISKGMNDIEVVVIGTLKNTLGPHHGNPSLGTAWPGMFQKAPNPGPPPGIKYHNVGYGLLKPFELHQR